MAHVSAKVWELALVCYDSVSSLALVEVRQGCRPSCGTRYGPGMPSLPAAAPLPARDLLSGPPRTGRVVGVHPSCVYVVTDPAESPGPLVVAVETADALGLPCALRLGLDRADRPFAGVHVGDPAQVGARRVEVGPLTVRVARWWAPPAVRPPAVRPPSGGPPRWADLAGLLRDVRPPVGLDGSHDLDPHDLLGRGAGLTPAGDDVLAGWLLAVHHDTAARGALLPVVAAARQATTTLSATLIEEAAAGRGVPAALAVADALNGHGSADDLEAALDRLLRVGHTSGAALAHGLLHGSRQSCHRLVSSRGDMSVPTPGSHQSARPDAEVAA